MVEGIFELVIDETKPRDPSTAAVLQIGGWEHNLTEADLLKMFMGKNVRAKRSPVADAMAVKPPRDSRGSNLEIRRVILSLLRKRDLSTGELKALIPPEVLASSGEVGVLMYQMKVSKLVENDGPGKPWRLVGNAPKRTSRGRR